MNPKRRVEAAIQRATVAWVWDTYPLLMVHATMNENSKEFISMGVCVGIPDLLIMLRWNGVLHVLFLELKTKAPNSILRDSQVKWYRESYQGKLECDNTCYGVAYGFEQAKASIKLFYDTVTKTT